MGVCNNIFYFGRFCRVGAKIWYNVCATQLRTTALTGFIILFETAWLLFDAAAQKNILFFCFTVNFLPVLGVYIM